MAVEGKSPTPVEKDSATPARRRSAVGGRRKRRLRKKSGAVLTFVLVGLIVFFTVGYLECIRSTPGESDDVTKGLILGPIASGKYEDDITDGRSKRGFVKVKVQVEFTHGKIESVKVLLHRHLWPKAKKATRRIPKLIVEKQSTRVQAVSGATLSSKVIMLAVQNALDNNQKKNRWDVYERTGEGGRWDDKY